MPVPFQREPHDVRAIPALSVVVPTLRGWPAMVPCLDALVPQLAPVRAELVIADGSGQRAPELAPGVRWLVEAGAGLYDLRACGLAATRAALIALTEDHCLVSTDWCASILRAHDRFPRADLIKGVVVNGSATRLVDCAAFLINQIAHVSPLASGRYARLCGIANVAFTRRWLESQDLSSVAHGVMQSNDSGALVTDEGIRVAHVQSEVWHEMAALQFHNARAVAGRRRPASRARWLGLLEAPFLPWARLARLLVAYREKNVSWRSLWLAAPWMMVLLHSKGAGEIVGALSGPGDSPRRIQ